MAKKRKAVKRSGGRRRRRVSGIVPGKEQLMTLAGAAAGLAAVSFISSKLPSTLDAKIKSGIILAGGVFLAGQKNALVRGLGTGMAALGGYQLVNALKPGTLPAITGAPYVILDRQIAGYNNFPNNPQRNVIAGYNSYPNNPQRNVIAGVSPVRAAGAGAA